ncbi:uncharacterized protein PV09_05273 [Verruconis gallopava]|uniref:Uncharacterized protein n=1 Tax=Verruconis gallopava TaxID=253628 RepID=A0A0D1YSD5_9PEZI|nr:uncharacterized protein PV09_05273 [Verruconis gallopava]KIW03507.1 hypothetical protein PV09_05273 [Verruconis gallopava]
MRLPDSLQLHFIMVAQEDGLNNKNDEVTQQRKSIVAAAIRRGTVKISEPILWVEGVPSNSQPAAAAVEPQGPAVETSTKETEEGDKIHGLAISTDEPTSVVRISGDGPTVSQAQLPPPNAIRETIESRVSYAPAESLDQKSEHKRSIFVEDDMDSPRQTAAEKKRARRSGTLRTVLRSVFGRKKKTQSKHISPPPSRSTVKHEYSRSDPLPGSRSKTPSAIQPGRSISSQNARQTLNEDELDVRSTPVQQMLPFPMNVNAPQPESPSKERRIANYLSFETSPKVHRRRATLSSMIISPEDNTVLHKMWSTTDLAPINSASETSPLDSIEQPGTPIGVAVSGSIANPNRRSRSAGALHELAKKQAQDTHVRRLSSEIKYWRASHIASLQDDARERKTQPQEDLETPVLTSPRASSIEPPQTEVSEVFAETGSSIHEGHLEPIEYGSEASELAPADKGDGLVEQRLLQLESSMRRLSVSVSEYAAKVEAPKEREFALKPAPRTNTPQVVFQAPASGRQAYTENESVMEGPQKNPSMRFAQPSRAVPSPSPSKGSYQHSYVSSTTTLQPLGHYSAGPSSVQSAPQSSSPSVPNTQYVTQNALQEHFVPLYNALRYERQIRKALETQVAQLRNDVIDLSAMVAQLRKQSAYMQTNGSSPGGSSVKAFGFDVNERSRFSGYDSSDAEGDAPRLSPQEQWTTPREEQSRQWGSTVEGDMF